MRTVGPVLAAVALAGATLSAQVVDEQSRLAAVRHYRIGQEYFLTERWDRAEEEFLAAIRLDPLLTLAHYGLGRTYMALKRYPAAIRAYLRCRQAYETLAWLDRSRAAEVESRREDEIRELRDATRLVQSGRIKTTAHAATLLEIRVQDLERARQRDPGGFAQPAELSLALGSAYFRTGRLEAAEREYLAATEQNPKLGEAHNNLAVLYLMTGRVAEARARVTLAKKSGYRVHPGFEGDLEAAERRRQ